MEQTRDYVTSVELMITTGLDRATIDYILSFLTPMEMIMSLRSDLYVNKVCYMHSINNRWLFTSDSCSYLKRFIDCVFLPLQWKNAVASYYQSAVTNRSVNIMRYILDYHYSDIAVQGGIAACDCISLDNVECLKLIIDKDNDVDFVDAIESCIFINSIKCLKYMCDNHGYAVNKSHVELCIKNSLIEPLKCIHEANLMSIEHRITSNDLWIASCHKSIECYRYIRDHVVVKPVYETFVTALSTVFVFTADELEAINFIRDEHVLCS